MGKVLPTISYRKMYSPSVNYELISQSGVVTKVKYACFAKLLYSESKSLKEYIHIVFHVRVHKSAEQYKQQWIDLLKSFGKIKGTSYNFNPETNDFTLIATNSPIYRTLWFLTFVRYLQEFPEIVVDFCKKGIKLSGKGFPEFIKSHGVTCQFYNNLSGHGLFCGSLHGKTPVFTTYADFIRTGKIPAIQSIVYYSTKK